MKHLWWIPIALLAVGLAVGRKGKTGRELGLSPGSVFQTTVAAAADRTGKDPGEGELVPPAHRGAPPVVPHVIGDFLPITRRENLCIECHGDADSGAPVIPASHYFDLRNAPKERRETIAGSRNNCTACHITQTGAGLLVINRFPR